MPFDLLCCVRPGVEDVQELDYSHQSITEVPSDVFIYERTLETLYCQSNRITELPRQLFMCHGLKYLDLSDNDLQSLPAAISSLVNLRHLNLSTNAITSLPETMKSLKHLVFLDLSRNPLEKLPDAITNLIALQELYLNDTYLEYLPGNFGRLSNLRILELRENYLMILPKSLARLTELNRLDIGQNEFQQFPEVIGKFTKLRELWVDSNSLTCIPAFIKPLSQLYHLEASNNMIEELSSEISYCTELLDISLSSNNLTQLPDSIGHLTKVVTLKLERNKLYEIPDTIGQMECLEELVLMSNYLDSLPSSIGLLRNLQYLNIDENLLRSIPPEIGCCKKLSVLSLRCNKLSSVPAELGHLSSLRVLNLVKNSLSSLPATLLNCDNLVALWLSDNQSKPLVQMHTETEPKTYQQILTCYLFPQVPSSPVDKHHENDKSSAIDSQASSRHISFVDMKPTPKAPEKPGQLKRAPTPYPKELRALAKHVRTKENSSDVPQAMQSAVHIKAAKITPTLQQRFASDNGLNNDSISRGGKQSPYENSPNNPYDKPLNLDYQNEKTYQGVNHELYPEPSNSPYNCKSDNTSSLVHDTYTERPFDSYSVTRETVDGNVSSSGSYHPSDAIDNKRASLQRLSVSSQDRLTPSMRAMNEPSYGDSHGNYDTTYIPTMEGNYHGNVYDRESYAYAKEKIYGRRRYELYNNYNTHRDSSMSRASNINQNVSSSSTMPNICEFDNVFSEGNNREGVYSSGPELQSSPNGNVYSNKQNYRQADLYSPTGHTNFTNPYRMTDTPLLSEDGSYTRSNRSHNTHSIYESMPDNNEMAHTSGQIEPTYARQPPPYHIAAPYTKQAHYFNGTG